MDRCPTRSSALRISKNNMIALANVFVVARILPGVQQATQGHHICFYHPVARTVSKLPVPPRHAEFIWVARQNRRRVAGQPQLVRPDK